MACATDFRFNLMDSLREHQSRAGKSRMAKLTKEQRVELGRKAGLISAQKYRENLRMSHGEDSSTVKTSNQNK
jgi:hypothetical protein